jgi:hypothetical protein
VINGKPVDKTVVVPVLALTRTDPKAVQSFKDMVKSYQ